MERMFLAEKDVSFAGAGDLPDRQNPQALPNARLVFSGLSPT
jgi:hypothetical protein